MLIEYRISINIKRKFEPILITGISAIKTHDLSTTLRATTTNGTKPPAIVQRECTLHAHQPCTTCIADRPTQPPRPHTSLTQRLHTTLRRPNTCPAMPASAALAIAEQDEAGVVTSTYILSANSRIDVIVRVFKVAGIVQAAQLHQRAMLTWIR